MQIFGNRFAPPDFPDPPRANFDSIVNAMLTSTIVATGESWNEIYVDVHRKHRAVRGLEPTNAHPARESACAVGSTTCKRPRKTR